MKITVLLENLKCNIKNLKNEHGLSLYIEKDDNHILFDTGKSSRFIENAKELGISLEKVNIVIISHAHKDHIGGLLFFLQMNKKAKIYMKKEVLNTYYFSLLGIKKNISINKKIFSNYLDRICFVDTFTEIIKDVFLFTKIEEKYSLPLGNKVLYTKKETNLIPDIFEHELFMVIKEANNINIFTGCGHRGVANMILTAKMKFPNINIGTLIGGFHLISIPIINLLGSKNDINTIIKIIKNEKIDKIYTGHCTGKNAYRKLKNSLGKKIQYLKLGEKIEF